MARCVLRNPVSKLFALTLVLHVASALAQGQSADPIVSSQEPSKDASKPAARRSAERPHGPKLTEEQLAEVNAFLAEHLPRLRDELEYLRASGAKRYEREMASLFPRVSRMMREKETDPELFELSLAIEKSEFSIRRTLKRLGNTRSSRQRTAQINELRELLSKQFDLEQQRSFRQLDALEVKLKAFREHLEQRATQKEALLDQELEERLAGRDIKPRPTSTRPESAAPADESP